MTDPQTIPSVAVIVSIWAGNVGHGSAATRNSSISIGLIKAGSIGRFTFVPQPFYASLPFLVPIADELVMILNQSELRDE